MRLSVGAVFLFMNVGDTTTRAFLSPESLLVANRRASAFEHRQSSPGGADGPRPVGRNRDADSISNKADVYFAQLKMDSRIRKQAFMDGDTEKSNEVFGDERVVELGETLQRDPQIQSRKEQVFETSAEEMIALMASTSSEETPHNNPDSKDQAFETSAEEMIALMASTSSEETPTQQPVKQISYKEKLLAAKNRKLVGDPRAAAAATTTTQPSQSDPNTPQTADMSPRETTTQARASATSSIAPPAVVVDHISTAVSPPGSTGPVSDEDVAAAIEYAAATIQMYKLAPDSQKPALTPILRSALTTAVAKLDV
eukprot:CAMPEP_0172518606 /NCGR_PEP_ID=MMETSP1066-20121228/290921_1 /TAXON_ID=671091 /ORGANISM="Coscinodiscus wailesii, Strain CCMP2513" /LENGTH=312 /DNA_ID=CAMNT_0013301031 /DNA_START=164 /DNA_END=1104 /DNA_ORIENTATION=-